MYVNDEGKLNLGRPKALGVSIKGTILEHPKGEKIRIAKFKAKAKYRRVTGHRQHLTKLKIDEIKASP
jgi:large subunit ribosomal protein L21